MCRTLIDRWFPVFGFPKAILTDNGSHFRNSMFQALRQLCDIRILYTTAYNPGANGRIERWHRHLKEKLVIYKSGKEMKYGNEWDSFVPHIVQHYNSMPVLTIGMSPFRALSGMDMRCAINAVRSWTPEQKSPLDDEETKRIVSDLQKKIRDARKSVTLTAKTIESARQKNWNRNRSETMFSAGDTVYRLIGDPKQRKLSSCQIRLPLARPQSKVFRVIQWEIHVDQ